MDGWMRGTLYNNISLSPLTLGFGQFVNKKLTSHVSKVQLTMVRAKTLVSNYMMLSFERKRLRLKYSKNLQLLVEKFIHNIIEQCVFVHVDPKIITMGCPNLVQIRTYHESPCTKLGHLMIEFLGPTWSNAHCLIMLCCIHPKCSP